MSWLQWTEQKGITLPFPSYCSDEGEGVQCHILSRNCDKIKGEDDKMWGKIAFIYRLSHWPFHGSLLAFYSYKLEHKLRILVCFVLCGLLSTLNWKGLFKVKKCHLKEQHLVAKTLCFNWLVAYSGCAKLLHWLV